jgi:hypothetical protein
MARLALEGEQVRWERNSWTGDCGLWESRTLSKEEKGKWTCGGSGAGELVREEERERLMADGIVLSRGLSCCRKNAAEEEEQGKVVVALMGSSACVNMRAGKEEEGRLACGRRAAVRESVAGWEHRRYWGCEAGTYILNSIVSELYFF